MPKPKNTGKPLEKLVQMIADAYDQKGILRLRKVDPPSAWVKGKPILVANPWPDFVGTWTRRGGRMLAVEAKSTAHPYLALGQDGGLTRAQVANMAEWSRRGAVSVILWECHTALHVVPIGRVLDIMQDPQLPDRVKTNDSGIRICKQGMGFVIHDFEAELASLFQPTTG